MRATKRIVLLLLISVYGASCNNWLDVSPKTEVKESDMFSNEAGFRDALMGVYSLMTTPNSYGKELTFGFNDVIAQDYSRFSNTHHEYYYAVRLQYEETTADQNRLANIWKTNYKAIANLNSLLAHIDEQKSVFESPAHYQLIKGEALGLRALLHFDLFRLFAPSPIMGTDLQAIPYYDALVNTANPPLTVGEFMMKVKTDLVAAQNAMIDYDSYGPNYSSLVDSYANDDLLKDRTSRMNYMAVTALLARVDLYGGDKAAALVEAAKIIGNVGDVPMAPIELVSQITSHDKLCNSELFFGLEMKGLKNIISPYFGETASSLGTAGNNTLYSSTYAVKTLFKQQNPADADFRSVWYRSLNSSYSLPDKYTDQLKIPLLHVSELYLIAAECAPSDVDGLSYLNTIRSHRGLVPLTDASQLQSEILKEYEKEFMCEGQLFFYYKRLNAPALGVYSKVTVSDSQKTYVMPIPVDEMDYGNYN